MLLEVELLQVREVCQSISNKFNALFMAHLAGVNIKIILIYIILVCKYDFYVNKL